MLYLASFNYKPREYRVVDMKDKTITDIGYRDLKELVSRHKISNLTMKYGEVCGKGLSLDKFPRITERKGAKFYIARKLLIHGKIYRFTCIYGNGQVEDLDYDTTFKCLAMFGCVNAITKGENIVLKENTYDTFEVGRKEIKYSLEDYERLFKYYEKLGLGRKSISHNYMRADLVFGKAIPMRSMTSNFNNFVEGHKYISIILSKSKIVEYGRVYDTYEMDARTFELHAGKLIGYLITYYNPKVGYHSILVSSKDKKLCSYLEKKGLSVRENQDTLESLMKYSSEEIEDKKYETVGQVEDYKIAEENVLRVGTLYSLNNGEYKSEFGGIKIKDTVRVGNTQEILLLNRLE